jgi:hypothetical protein
LIPRFQENKNGNSDEARTGNHGAARPPVHGSEVPTLERRKAVRRQDGRSNDETARSRSKIGRIDGSDAERRCGRRSEAVERNASDAHAATVSEDATSGKAERRHRKMTMIR